MDIRRTSMVAAGICLLALFSINPLAPQAAFAMDKSRSLSIGEVIKLMARTKVEHIFAEEYEEGLIKRVVYDISSRKSNFDDIIGQNDLEPEARKPVLVYFYDNLKLEYGEDYSSEERVAVMFKKLANVYGKEIIFASFEINVDPKLAEGQYAALEKKHSIKDTPSIAMYSPFDLLKGERQKSHKGNVRQVDILNGGPTANKWVAPWMPFIFSWIDSNLWKPDGGVLLRFYNSADGRKVNY